MRALGILAIRAIPPLVCLSFAGLLAAAIVFGIGVALVVAIALAESKGAER